jgi:uncharacterized protein YpuA (DUF1002 family)
VELNSVISVSAFLLSVLSAVFTVIQIRYTQANIEIAIRNRISEARKRVDDYALKIISEYKNSENYENDRELYKHIEISFLEEELNAYEEACQKYIDNKVHRATFKKSYMREIANLFKARKLRDILFCNEGFKDFKHLHMVREKWGIPVLIETPER